MNTHLGCERGGRRCGGGMIAGGGRSGAGEGRRRRGGWKRRTERRERRTERRGGRNGAASEAVGARRRTSLVSPAYPPWEWAAESAGRALVLVLRELAVESTIPCAADRGWEKPRDGRSSSASDGGTSARGCVVAEGGRARERAHAVGCHGRGRRRRSREGRCAPVASAGGSSGARVSWERAAGRALVLMQRGWAVESTSARAADMRQ